MILVHGPPFCPPLDSRVRGRLVLTSTYTRLCVCPDQDPWSAGNRVLSLLDDNRSTQVTVASRFKKSRRVRDEWDFLHLVGTSVEEIVEAVAPLCSNAFWVGPTHPDLAKIERLMSVEVLEVAVSVEWGSDRSPKRFKTYESVIESWDRIPM